VVKTKKNIFFRSLLLIIPFVIFGYSYWIEPVWIEVSRHAVKADIKDSLTIAHLSDLHIRSLGSRESKILEILEQEKPNAVVITGDSVAENGNYQAVGTFLKKIRVPLGVWLVNGNWEHWRPSDEDTSIYQSAGVHFLNNSAEQLVNDVWLVGVDDELAGQPDLKSVYEIPKNAFRIGLFHSPSFFDESSEHFDLVLAGHTHGGQIRLPFLPPLWLPEGSGRFVSGLYRKGNSQMYVSRGLGNSIIDVRLLCRPELSIIKISR